MQFLGSPYHQSWAPTKQELTAWKEKCRPAIANVLALPQALTMEDLLPTSLVPSSPLFRENAKTLLFLTNHAKETTHHIHWRLFEGSESLFSERAYLAAQALGYTPSAYIYATVLHPNQHLFTSEVQRFENPLDTLSLQKPGEPAPAPTVENQLEAYFWQTTNKEIFFRANAYMKAAVSALFVDGSSLSAAICHGKEALAPQTMEDLEFQPALRLPTAQKLRERLLPNALKNVFSAKPH